MQLRLVKWRQPYLLVGQFAQEVATDVVACTILLDEVQGVPIGIRQHKRIQYMLRFLRTVLIRVLIIIVVQQ